MAPRIGGLSPENTRLVLEVAKYLRDSGFVIPRPEQDGQASTPLTPIYVRNDSGEAIPAWGCMQSTGATESGGQNFITVGKPVDITGAAGSFLFNGIAEIESGGYGVAYAGPLVRSYKSSGSFTSGGKCRPTVGQWYITIDTAGPWSMVGEDDIGTGVVRISLLGGNFTTVTVVTAVQVSGYDLQYKTRSITVPAAGSESAWTTWHTGTSCP